jgi:hypothetical protein
LPALRVRIIIIIITDTPGGDSSGFTAHATVDETTRVTGLTIQDCEVGIRVEAGVRVVFEALVVRSCRTGIYVNTEATAAFLAIRRCTFTQSANVIASMAANATLRIEETIIYDIGRSFEKKYHVENSTTGSGANVTGRMSSTTLNNRRLKRRKMLKRLRSQFAMKFNSSQKETGGSMNNVANIAAMYLMGHMSYVQIVDVTFCNIEHEAIMGASPFLHLTVERSRFLANCTGAISVDRQGQQPLHRSTIGIALLADSGNLSISDTVFDGFDNNAVKVHGEKLSVSIASVRVAQIGPKARLLKLQRMTVINAGVRITGFRLMVTIRNSEFF